MGLKEMSACLRAVYEPADPDREPIHKSRSIKEAIARMEQEAVELKDVALGNPPFCGTMKSVSDRMG